jgi:hypothetical protein
MVFLFVFAAPIKTHISAHLLIGFGLWDFFSGAALAFPALFRFGVNFV